MTVEDPLPFAIRNASTVRSLKAGEILFSQGSPTLGVYEVLSGSVRLARTDHVGHHAVVYVARVGDHLAEASLFSSVYHCEAVAVTNAVVRYYPKAMLISAFERDVLFAKSYAAMLARQLMSARARVERLNMRSARDRILHFITLNSGDDELSVEITGTLKEFAHDLGLTHEVLYRTLAQMTQDGEIERTARTLRLLALK